MPHDPFGCPQGRRRRGRWITARSGLRRNNVEPMAAEPPHRKATAEEDSRSRDTACRWHAMCRLGHRSLMGAPLFRAFAAGKSSRRNQSMTSGLAS